jgi:hypothetical protein
MDMDAKEQWLKFQLEFKSSPVTMGIVVFRGGIWGTPVPVVPAPRPHRRPQRGSPREHGRPNVN